MYDRLPARFQVRVHAQALVNALRRPTSDRMKLLRLATEALGALDRSGIDEEALRRQLSTLRLSLESAAAVDLVAQAAELERVAAAVDWSVPAPVRVARAPVAVAGS